MRRLVIGIGLAIGLAAVLWFVLDRSEAQAEVIPVPVAGAPTPERPRAVLPAAIPRGGCASVALGRHREDLGDRAPIVEIRRGGSVRIVTGPPAPSSPTATGSSGGAWRAGILLPRLRLTSLSARERSALLEVLRAFSGDSGLRPEQIRATGVAFRPEELASLLRWRR